MKLESRRLLLRPVSLSDAELVHALHSLPETDEYNMLGIPKSMAETQKLLTKWLGLVSENQKHVFCLEDRTGHFIGLAGMNMGKPGYNSAEIWYKIHVAHWNKGYATEAVKTLLSFCFNELKLHRVAAGCAVQNLASSRVLEKCGFVREGHCRKILPIRGEWVDNYEYAILEEDYAGGPLRSE